MIASDYVIEIALVSSVLPMRGGRRIRGWLLRLVLNRALAIALGLLLLAPAVWLLVGEYPWETPVTDGLALLLGSTGAALLLAGIGGRRPDWYDTDG